MVMTPQRPRPDRRGDGQGRSGRDIPAAAPEGTASAKVTVRRIFERATADYALILGTTVFLVGFGLVMVLSSSSIENFASSGNVFGSFTRQALAAVVALPLMLVVSTLPMAFWRRWAWLVLAGAAVLQLLVFTGLGAGSGGNRAWVSIGGFTLQPSEFLKLGVILWIALMIGRIPEATSHGATMAKRILPIPAAAIMLVMLGSDLGTAMVIALAIMGALFFAGTRGRILAAITVVGAIGVVILAQLSPSRVERIVAWVNGTEDYEGIAWQSTHALYALSAGGFFGLGLGNSKAKRGWIPEVENDFIFAVIGEELGLLGAIVVLLLFIVLAVGFFRVIAGSRDPFVKIVTGGIAVWLIGQAFINIAVVLGLLPVLGVPLPFISSGGSSLLAAMVAIGIVLSFARRPAEAQIRAPAPRSAARSTPRPTPRPNGRRPA